MDKIFNFKKINTQYLKELIKQSHYDKDENNIRRLIKLEQYLLNPPRTKLRKEEYHVLVSQYPAHFRQLINELAPNKIHHIKIMIKESKKEAQRQKKIDMEKIRMLGIQIKRRRKQEKANWLAAGGKI